MTTPIPSNNPIHSNNPIVRQLTVVTGTGVFMRQSFFVSGRPHAKARPRLGRGGNVYTPLTTVEWETEVKATALELGIGKMLGAVSADLLFYLPGRGPAYKAKGDVDNLTKAVLDALNGIAYEDDIQVVRLLVEKRRAGKLCVGVQVTLLSVGDLE